MTAPTTPTVVDISVLNANPISPEERARQSQHSRDILIRFLHAELEEMDSLIAKDAYWWGVGVGELKRADFIPAHAATLALGPPQSKVRTLIGLAADGEWASMEWTVETHWSDRAYKQIYHHSFIVRDSLIHSMRMYMDQDRAKVFYPDIVDKA